MVAVTDLGEWAIWLSSVVAAGAAKPERICRLCVSKLDVSGAGISVITTAGNRGVVCATDERAALIEDVQFTAGVGPCMDAAQNGRPVLLPDLANGQYFGDGRWPTFSERAHLPGIAAIFAFPLRIGATTIGALDLYRDRPGDLTTGQLSAALLAADAAAIALLDLDTTRDDAFADDSEARAAYQLHVHQATGMVKVQANVSIDDALLLLRARAFSSGRSLSDVAADVVGRRVRFSAEDT